MIKGLLTPYGRTRRLRYLAWVVVIDVIGAIAVSATAGTTPQEATMSLAVTIALLWPVYCLMCSRLHDADRTSILAITTIASAVVASALGQAGMTLGTTQRHAIDAVAAIMAVATAIQALVVMVLPPTRGANRYGLDPREPAFVETPIDGPPPGDYDGTD